LEEGLQPQISIEELVNCDNVVRNDPLVLQLAKDVGMLPIFLRILAADILSV
jgi:primary-amine oxidase